MALHYWSRKKAGTDTFWNKGDKMVTVGQSLGTKEWFTFIDGGKDVKVVIKYAKDKKDALRIAQAYLRNH